MLHQMDPVGSMTDRLYQFWQAYQEEAALLERWHSDAADVRQTDPKRSNALFNSFLETWGEGDFEDSNVDLATTSYFAALGKVSRWLRKECLEVLAGDADGVAVVDGSGKPMLVSGATEGEAEAKINALKVIFDFELDSLTNEIDPVAEAQAQTRRPEDSPYLPALHRMMAIETACFRSQRDFLAQGRVS